MSSLLKQSVAGLRLLLVFTVLLGIAYPLAVWTVSRVPGLHDNAEGQVTTVDSRVTGSALIGIGPVFTGPPRNDPYFHPRPSASAENPLGPADPSTSGGSNDSADNPELLDAIRARQNAVADRENAPQTAIPPDAVTASASGLDPDISPAYAELQAPRVARNNHLSLTEVRTLIEQATSGGIGVPSVNVGELNRAIRADR